EGGAVGDRPGAIVVLRLDRVDVLVRPAVGGDVREVAVDQADVVRADRVARRNPVDGVRLVRPHHRPAVVNEIAPAEPPTPAVGGDVPAGVADRGTGPDGAGCLRRA